MRFRAFKRFIPPKTIKHGAWHNDIKPENLLVTAEGYLKVIDWGFAKDLSGSSDNNTTFTLCGTPE